MSTFTEPIITESIRVPALLNAIARNHAIGYEISTLRWEFSQQEAAVMKAVIAEHEAASAMVTRWMR